MGLGGPIGLNCESVGCFGQYMCCKCNKIRVCQRMILSYFLSILVTCAQNNTFLIREGTCPWCRKAYKSFTPQGLVDRSKSLGAVAAIILADFSSKNIYVFYAYVSTMCPFVLEDLENQHLRGSSEDQEAQRRAAELEEQLAAATMAGRGPPADGGQYRPDTDWDQEEPDEPPPPPQLPTVVEEEEEEPAAPPVEQQEGSMEQEDPPLSPLQQLQRQVDTIVVVVGPNDPQGNPAAATRSEGLTQQMLAPTDQEMEVGNFVLPPRLPPARDDADQRPHLRVRVPGRRLVSVNPPVRPLPINTLQYFEALRESSQLKVLLREIFSHNEIAVTILEECALTSRRYLIDGLASTINNE